MTKGTILYAEDNNENRALVRRVLEADDFSMRAQWAVLNMPAQPETPAA